MEVSPRGGGNRLAEVIRLATGLDMITACVCAAVGDDIEELKKANEDLTNATNPVFTKMYQNMQQNPQGDPNANNGGNNDGDPEVVVE